MHSENLPTILRRSSRVPAELPILVTSLAGTQFSEVCKTLVVNAHGCALQTPVKFDAGIPLQFHSKDGRETTARVVSCQPIGPDNRAWRLGAKLDRPENFWRLSHCPEDWALPATSVSAGLPQIAPRTATQHLSSQAGQALEAKLDIVAQRLETPLRKLIAESFGPLEAQVAVLKQTVARREANPSRFDVSLSSIPPELEQQLEVRLRKDLEPKVLQESRHQYADLLESAKSIIDRRTTDGYESFLRRVAEDLKVVQKRAQEVSAEISANVDEHLRQGLKDFQRKLLDGGRSLKRLSEELLEFLQNNLTAEYNARREDLEQLRTSAAMESARLRQEIDRLESRVAKLDESARSLESGLDKRLGEMSSNHVKDTRRQLESMVAEALDQSTANSVKTMGDQLAEATGKMLATRKDMHASFSDSLNVQTMSAMQNFEQSMEELAQQAVERWRLKLADSLNVLAKNLGEQL
jgi:uncharacterized phage infection (PIP) family protein YhgE